MVLDPGGSSALDSVPASSSVVATQPGTYRIVYFHTSGGSGPDVFGAGTPAVIPSTLNPKKPVTTTTTLAREVGVSFTGLAGQVVNGYSSWLSASSADETLVGPDGTPLAATYDVERRVWRLPSDGTYTLLHATRSGGEISALTATSGPELNPGSTTRLSVADPSRTVIAHFTVGAGEKVTLSVAAYTFGNADSVNGDFSIGVFAPSGFEPGGINLPAQDGSATSFTAIEPGTYDVVLQGRADATGSVDLTLSTQ